MKGDRVMTIREKIQAREEERANRDKNALNQAIKRMAAIILAGYAIGTVIALMIERLK